MAPMARDDHDGLEQELKDTIQTLFNIMVQVTNYDAASTSTISTPNPSAPAPSTTTASTTTTSQPPQPRPSRDVIAAELRTLSRSLQAIAARSSGSSSANLPAIPPELIQYVDGGRNPDIYTREFVELVRRGNQLLRGKQAAFARFRDVLAAEIAAAMPELARDAARVVDATSYAADG
ncbi:mediator complex, subunit Med10 [Xylariaceae sp. FL0662B]|nr:mediator complex, subunit Med10 [Xylariaceae sp. FL0662B]